MKSILVMGAFVMSAYAQLTAQTQNYNVTSPVSNGPYVINQILPCTYRLFSDVDTSELSLQITMVSAQASNTTNATIIAEKAETSTTAEFVKHEGNQTFYEHSINFQIPSTIKPGQYKVVFRDVTTNTRLSVPIEIRPPAAPTPTTISTLPVSSPDLSSLADSVHHAGAGTTHSPEWFVALLAMSMALGSALLTL